MLRPNAVRGRRRARGDKSRRDGSESHRLRVAYDGGRDHPWLCWMLSASLLLAPCLAADRWSLTSILITR